MQEKDTLNPNPTVSTESGGQMRFDISNVTFEDAYNVADKTYNQLFKNILLQKKLQKA